MLSSSSQIIPPHCQWIRLQQTEAHPFTFTPTHQPAPIPSNYLGPLGASSSNIPSLGVLFFRLKWTPGTTPGTPWRVPAVLWAGTSGTLGGYQRYLWPRNGHQVPHLAPPGGCQAGPGGTRQTGAGYRLSSLAADNRCTTSLASPSLHLNRSNEQSSRRVGFFFADNCCTTPLASPSLHLNRSNKQSSRRPFFRSPTTHTPRPSYWA
ncbi:uncharacterized protein PGTG_11960 [Puccinia graminis f. sp. tritici CRL 75-36-700-3]|uniref:Uncharacterized protein n=1 Tax=Puccinia graminis f. sp. tritici (strain CRL 75-36-700-3 / race SCCL) TaxID=418459 RepID=E3KNX9_PUCGT|nr:uncharacterized protein PGTG_11960 [Puccinia graminis f. sp. tritici CRL 75-36-700-3]EFP86004.1 hypothetical protein PGTG_11960 [Puccinia graminis f. sp. tritici CRL 75-36-700-3]